MLGGRSPRSLIIVFLVLQKALMSGMAVGRDK